MSGALTALSNEIDKLNMEIRAEKITTRQKAFDRLDQILSTRDEEIKKLLSQENDSWADLFDNAYSGFLKHVQKLSDCKGHKTIGTIENKNSLYVKVIQKIITHANTDSQNISYSNLLEKIYSVLDNSFLRQHFGIYFLQILLKNVLHSKGHLTEILINLWSEILHACIFIFKNDENIPKPFISECIHGVIKIGLEYSYISIEFSHYLKDIEIAINETEKGMVLFEWIKIAEIVCKNVAVDCRFSICELTENILAKVTSSHEPKLDKDMKIVIFQLCNLSIVVHNPNINISNTNMNLNNTNYATDPIKWNKCLKYIYFMIENEIKYLNEQILRYNLNPDMCPILIQLASRLSYLIFWNNDMWNEKGNLDSVPSSKRIRRADKIQSLMNLIDVGNNKYCWRWFLVLTELIHSYPEAFTESDFQPLLHLISNFQVTIQYPVQVRALVKCCSVLLLKEDEFLNIKQSVVISRVYCDGIWNKITEMAFRSSTTNNIISTEYHELLSLLIKYKKFLSNNFIINILKTYSTNSIIKSNMSVKTLIAIFETINIEQLENFNQIMIDFLNWLYFKSTSIQLTKAILNNDKITIQDKAKITVLCLITSMDNRKLRLINNSYEIINNYDNLINEIEKNISLKSLNTIILTKNSNDNDNFHYTKLLPLEIKCVLNEKLYEHLITLITFHTEPLIDNLLDEIIKVFSSVEFCLEILHNLINYGVLNEDKLKTSIFMKKLSLLLQKIEICFVEINSISLERKDINDILEGLLPIFNINYHYVLGRFIRSRDFSNVLKWITKLLNNELKASKHFEIIDLNELEGKEKIKWKALKLLTIFIHYDGINLDQVIDILLDLDLNLENNLDLNIILHMIQLMCRQTSSSSRAIWCINHIKNICMKFHKYQSFSEVIIDLFSGFVIYDLLGFVCQYSDLTRSTLIAFRSFIIKCKNKTYSPRLTLKIIEKIKYLARSYPTELNDSSFEFIYNTLGEFILFPNLSIQYSAIKSLSYLFNKQWIQSNDLTLFHQTLFPRINLRQLSEKENESIDYKQNIISVNIHFFSSLLSINYLLRRECLFSLLEFSYNEKVTLENLKIILNETCHILNIKTSALITYHIEYLLKNWLIKDISIMFFPWYLTECKTQKEFFFENKNLLTICFLNHKLEMIDEFHKILEIPVTDLIMPILDLTLAQILPSYARCPNLSVQQQTKCSALHKNILKYLTDDYLYEALIKYVTEVIQQLFMNLIDEKMFKSMFDVKLKFCSDDNSINTEILMQCLQYIQGIFKPPEDVDLITHFCLNEPYRILIILNGIKLKIQTTKIIEQKLEYIFRYCILVKLIMTFMNFPSNEQSQSDKHLSDNIGFFIKDSCYFLCHLMASSEDKNTAQIVVSLKFFEIFSQSILPNCFQYIQIHLNYIVSTLLPLCKYNDLTVKSTAIDILKFLIIENKNLLENSIELLDDFPKDEIFENIRNIYKAIKYKKNNSNLLNEIEHFLKVKNRKVEGLIGLKEQLSNKKDELLILYRDLTGIRGFSEDCEKSILHKLIFELLQCVKSNDIDIRIEAAKCLGELGPGDLITMVLKPYIESTTYKKIKSFDGACNNFCIIAFDKLSSLLFDSDISVVNAVCNACLHLAQTKFGRKFIDNYSYLKIFLIENKHKKNELLFQRTDENLINVEYLNDTISHSQWIKQLTSDLFEMLGNKILSKISFIHLSFAESMLPMLSQIILHFDNLFYTKNLERSIQCFFQKHFELSQNENFHELNSKHTIYMDKSSIKLMLEVVECIRMYNQLKLVKQIELDYLPIAKAALYCELYFTSILYCELWTLKLNLTNTINEPININLQNIMKKSYLSIGDLDATTVFLDPIHSRISYLQYGNSWEGVCLEYDSIYAKDNINSTKFKNSLINSGLYNLASILPNSNGDTDSHYECAWRLADWNALQFENQNIKTENSFEEYHYIALKSLYNRDELGMRNAVNIARKSIIDSWKNFSFECTESIYKNLLMLQQLQQIEDFSEIQFKKLEENFQVILDKWSIQDKIQLNDFKYKEPILSQRTILFETGGLHAKRIWTRFSPEPIQNILLKIISEARQESYKNIAFRNLAKLKNLEKTKATEAKVLLEDSQLNWSLGDKLLGEKIMYFLAENKAYTSTLSKVVALRLHGEYLAESRSENTIIIVKEYFKKSLKLLNIFAEDKDLSQKAGLKHKNFSLFQSENQLMIFESIAKYTDREYVKKNNYIKSPEYERKKNFVRNNEDILNRLKPKVENGTINNDEKKTFFIMKKNSLIDLKEMESVEKECEEYLKYALIYYIRSCIASTSNTDLSIFRLISLWFSNKTNDVILNLIDTESLAISSYKYLSVLPQISARITKGDDKFGQIIFKIFETCAIDHPHHTLNQLFSLANSHCDSQELIEPEPRVVGAERLIKILTENDKISSIIIQMKKMCENLIKLANVGLEIKDTKPIIEKLNNFNLVQCPTYYLPVSLNCKYTNIISIIKWSSDISKVGGINEPKKISCICSDGICRPQLLKGKDDLRQDAVMQQVFTIMNTLLKKNKDANKRKLSVRTYKVVPLSQRSGILEWCENTTPLGVYLIGSSSKEPGAHAKYRPNDLKPSDCRKLMTDARSTSNENRLKIYLQICAKFKPVFQYFFFQHFPNPGVWYERRLSYVNSIATNSMIGYILGLGDRHVQNILVDKSTAEVIHIDFGIAFEQGQILPTPETVPFRLTRDIIAPMGFSGVDGVFRKSCEKTMKVLRQNQGTIETILEVLLYDPLYAWTMTNQKAYSLQSVNINSELEVTHEEKNTTAERALMCLQKKLNGEEDGATGMSSVEAQIRRLIQQAQDPINLSKLFSGWQPYL